MQLIVKTYTKAKMLSAVALEETLSCS